MYSLILKKFIKFKDEYKNPKKGIIEVKMNETHRRRNQGIAVGIQKQLRPGIGFLGEGDRICRNGRSTECLRNYLMIIN